MFGESEQYLKRQPGSKLAHIDACMKAESQYSKSAGFESVTLSNEAGVSLSMADISLRVNFLGKELAAPLMIAPMTGGVEKGAELNRLWARAAEHFQIAMGVGSQRVALEDAARCHTFEVRKHAPTAVLFANLGAEQICQGFGLEEAQRAVDMLEANALFIHLNAMQEACQGNEVDFKNLLNKIEFLCGSLKVPVFAREVGFGFSEKAARRLLDCGIAGLDCAGAGGTSWSKVEGLCTQSASQKRLGEVFGEWGIPTVSSIRNVRAVSQAIPLIATGGLRNGLHVAKAIALGANIAAMAQPMLLAAQAGEEALFHFIEQVLLETQIACFGAGAKNIQSIELLEETAL